MRDLCQTAFVNIHLPSRPDSKPKTSGVQVMVFYEQHLLMLSYESSAVINTHVNCKIKLVYIFFLFIREKKKTCKNDVGLIRTAARLQCMDGVFAALSKQSNMLVVNDDASLKLQSKLRP